MKQKFLFIAALFVCAVTFGSVNAASVSLRLSCPAAAKPNTEIKCNVYASASGSTVEDVETIKPVPTGALKRADYFINYENIPIGSQKNIGNLVIQTGNLGTGQIELLFDGIHFVDGSFQEATSVRKTIIINKTGKKTSHNSTASGSTTNNSQTRSTDTYLKDIRPSRGILSPSFSKNVYKYTVKVDSNVENISIDAIKNQTDQKIEGEVNNAKLKYGNNTFKLTVSNGNSAKRTYEVIINRADDRDTNALLSSISLSSGTIQFNPNIYNYETKVLYDIENIEVLATTEKGSSKAVVEGNKNLKVGENTITITVTSEKGTTQKYTIKVTRLPEGEGIGDNANIQNITVKGYKLEFNYSKFEYKLVIKNEKSLNIGVVMDDPNATFQIFGNNDLKDGSIIRIVTKSHDGTATQTYSITITKPNYSIYYVIGGLLAAFAIATPIIFYFKYVKPKKGLYDANGNRLTKEEIEQAKYRKRLATTVPGSKDKKIKSKQDKTQTNTNQNQTPQDPKHVVNVQQPIQNQASDSTVVNIPNGTNEPVNQENTQNNNMDLGSSKCPKCGRELLGTPDICPYCNTKLR